MQTLSIVDQVLSAVPRLNLKLEDGPLPPHGRENLAHYMLGTQEPWYDKVAERTEFLLRQKLLHAYRVLIEPSDPEAWQALIEQAQAQAIQQRASAETQQQQMQFDLFTERTRSHESKQQIQQRVWLALVMFSLGERGLSFELDGTIRTGGHEFGAPIGMAPDHILEEAKATGASNFYVATYAEHLRGSYNESDYALELARGRGRMRWYIHRLALSAEAERYLNLGEAAIHRRIALVVAGDEHATRSSLPRDYYRDPAFQQAVIDAEDGNFDITLVLSPRHHVVTLDQPVADDKPWSSLVRGQPAMWSTKAGQKLWQLCLVGPQVARTQPNNDRYMPSWSIWRHPDSRYEFTFFGLSAPANLLAQSLQANNAEIQLRPGYVTGDVMPDLDMVDSLMEDMVDEMIDELNLGELDDDARDEIHEALAIATEQATYFAETFYLPPPPGLGEIGPIQLDSEQAMEPIMVLRTRECDVDNILEEAFDLQVLLEGELLNFDLLLDAPLRLRAVLDIIHTIVHEKEHEVLEMIDQILPRGLAAVVRDSSLPLQEERLCPLLTYAEILAAFSTLLDTQDRDRLSVWQRTFWAAETRHRAQDDYTGRNQNFL